MTHVVQAFLASLVQRLVNHCFQVVFGHLIPAERCFCLHIAEQQEIPQRIENTTAFSQHLPELPEIVAVGIEMCMLFAVSVSTHIPQPHIKTGIGKDER